MDIEKLIERLRKEAYGSDIEDLLLGASTAIETLRAENVKLQYEEERQRRSADDMRHLYENAERAYTKGQAENAQLRESRDHWKRLAHELSEGVNDKDAEHERLQAENEKLRAEVESLKKEHCAGCSVPVVEAERLRDLNEAPNLRAELEQVKRERDEAVKDIELIVRRINDCNIKLDDGTTVSSLELGRCHVCKHEETGDCDDGGCIFEWRGQKED